MTIFPEPRLDIVIEKLHRAKWLLEQEPANIRYMKVGMQVWAAHSKAVLVNFKANHLLSDETLEQLKKLVKLAQEFDMAWQLKHHGALHYTPTALNDENIQSWLDVAENIDYETTRRHLLNSIDSILECLK